MNAISLWWLSSSPEKGQELHFPWILSFTTSRFISGSLHSNLEEKYLDKERIFR